MSSAPDRFRERMRAWLEKLVVLSSRAMAADPDPEVCHVCRVSSRRLRTGLTVMARVGLVKAIGVRKLEQGLGRLARSLAPIRDADVLEEHLGKLWPAGVEQPDDPIWKATVTVLRRRLQARRQAALDALNRPGAVCFPLFERLRELIEKIESRRDTLEDASSLVERWATDFARRARLAIQIDRPDRWHRLRLLGKRLRYAIELTGDPDRPCSRHEKLVRVQQTLGRAHDHRVWEALCRSLRRQLRRRGSDVLVRAGLRALAAVEERRARHEEQRFGAEWREEPEPESDHGVACSGTSTGGVIES